MQIEIKKSLKKYYKPRDVQVQFCIQHSSMMYIFFHSDFALPFFSSDAMFITKRETRDNMPSYRVVLKEIIVGIRPNNCNRDANAQH